MARLPCCAGSISRRRFVATGAAGAIGLSLTSIRGAYAEVPPHDGCLLLDGLETRQLLAGVRFTNPFNKTETDFIESSGDPRLDHAFGIMLNDLAARFKVRPAFGFYDDHDAPNAFAIRKSLISDTEGSVLFGQMFLKDSLNRKKHGNFGDTLVMALCAHEFGHIVQMFSSYYERLTKGEKNTKRLELHADFLAGYYLGLRNTQYSYAEMADLGRSWEGIGSLDPTVPYYHGSPEERLGAIEEGFKIARQRPEITVTDASEVGAKYLGA